MSQRFYFDGKTSKANECNIHLSEEAITIYFKQEENEIIIWNRSEIKSFDLQGDTLYIKYGEFPSQSLEISGSEAIELFENLSKNVFTKISKNYWLKNKNKMAIYLCLGFIAFCFGSYFLFLPWIGEKAVSLIPKEAEIELGNSIAETIIKSNTEIDSASYFANQFVRNLKNNSNYPIHITVIKSDQINAFAVPGGNIFVYSEIIKKLDTYEEFFALLSHEMSHVNERHSLKSIGRLMASSFFVSVIFGDVSGITTGVLNQANEFKQLNYSRELETQADDEGYRFMLENKISPNGMLDLLKVLHKESEDVPQLMKYFSTHPQIEERINNIRNKSNFSKRFPVNNELFQIFENLKKQL